LSKSSAEVVVSIAVSDTGMGIDSEDLPRLFKRFEQVGKGPTFGGTGLGLSITKEIAGMMGGDVMVSSTLGVGTIFTIKVTLPMDVENSGSPKEERMVSKKVMEKYSKWAILVADDVGYHRKVLTLFLNKLGFSNIQEVTNGADAFSVAIDGRFDVVFMDIFMPQMNGTEAAKKILDLPHFRTTPIIGITASSLTEEQVSDAQNTFSYLLMKPLNIIHLEWVLERICGCEMQVGTLAEPVASPSKVLIIDDQTWMRRLVGITLKQAGMKVYSCGSGLDAIEMLKSTTFDLIMIDRVMPNMDGFEVAREIIDSSPYHPAVIIMSSGFSEQDIATSKNTGVDGIIEKPIHLEEFKSLWSRVKENRAKGR